MGYLGLNRSKTPLDSLLVRQAIAHAINKKSLAALYYNSGTQASTQFLPPGIWGFDSSISDYSYDPTLAKSLLTQAGYASGISIGLAYRTVVRQYLPDPDGTAAAIKADLAAANITANLDRYTNSTTFLNKVSAGDFDMFLLGWMADYPHPYNFFGPILCDQSVPYGPKDTELCTKVADGLTLQTDALRLDAFKWSSQRVYDTLPLIPLVNARIPLVTRRTISGVMPAILFENYQPAFVPSSWNFLPAVVKP